jgi:hypothetical protein
VTEPEVATKEVPIKFVGQQGLSMRRFINNNNSWSKTYNWHTRMDDPTQYDDSLAMQFELLETSTGYRQATVYRGWFVPPATGRYRFHQSCDDECDLTFGNSADTDTDVTKILDINHWVEFRRTSYS